MDLFNSYHRQSYLHIDFALQPRHGKASAFLPHSPHPTTPYLKLPPLVHDPRTWTPTGKHNFHVPPPQPLHFPFPSSPFTCTPQVAFLDQCNPTSQLIRPHKAQCRGFEVLIRLLRGMRRLLRGRRTSRPPGEEILLVIERQRRVYRRLLRTRMRVRIGWRRRHDRGIERLHPLTAAVGRR